MNKETFYGFDGFTRRNDNDAGDDFTHAKSGKQRDVHGSGEVTGAGFGEKPPLTIHNSNRTLDKYLFYFSSLL